ncbi:MAG: sigma-70 family RNA polymerase sigma factor [Deltaproteobacteria bacterium]|nr:sigma-70 family RNA polymerase sigma factor [Deltaproteobacteria bacterium]
MAKARPLSAAFCAAASAPEADLEGALARAVERARAAWTDAVTVSPETFAGFLGSRVPADGLESARVEDLWAACVFVRPAGGENDAAREKALSPAIAAVEARYFADVDAALGKMGLGADRIGEVKQGLRRVLFVGDPTAGVAPRITEYKGSGDLRAWLRVTAMRAALKLLRKENRETPTDDALLEARAQTDDPELGYMKAAYRAAFKTAFQEALDSLDAKERTLLKQQIVDGLSIDELGALYQVHRATAARWVQSAREKLLGRTRRTFMLNARISSDECESIMRMVRSQLDVSLHRRLGAG